MKDVAIHGFAGLVNTLPVERLRAVPAKDAPLVDLAEAVNVDLDDTGRLSLRAGQQVRVAGPAPHSIWSNANQTLCLYVRDGVMYRLDEAYQSTAIAAGLSADPVSYVEVNDRVYHANGNTSAVVDQGRVRSWGIRLADIDCAASATAGNLEAGVYLFAMTLLRRDGQESGALMAQRLDLTAQGGILFTWSVPADPDLTEACFYLTQPNGEVLLQAAIVDVEMGSYTYTGGQRSLPLATQWLDAPPVASSLAHYRGRLYLAVADVLYATAALSYEHCDLRDYRAFDGSEIRVIGAVDGGLFIGTAQAVWFLSGAVFADHALTKKLDAAAVKGSLVMADGELVTGNPQLAGVVVVLFATAAGIVLGLPDGTLHNLTQPRYTLPAGTQGAAVLRPGPATQYLLALPS